MHNDDNDSENTLGGSPPEGLGHDPLEWLQEDDDSPVAQAESGDSESKSEESASRASSETEQEENTENVSSEPVPEVSAASEEPAASSDEKDSQSLTIDNHKAIIKLPEKLSVQIVEPLHTEWKTLFYDLPQSLEIDAGEVKDVDAAGMQLLYVLVQQMSFKGCDVVVLNVHHNLKRYVKVAGLEEFFTQFVHAA